MKLKKYKEYIKENINDTNDTNDFGVETTEEISEVEDQIVDSDESNSLGSMPVDSLEQEEETEEEGDEYEGNKLMKELAEKLNVKVNNNYITYKGKKISYPSEILDFKIEGVKKKFGKSVEDIYNFLQEGSGE